MSKAFIALFLAGFLAVPAFGQQTIEQQKIEYLINLIANLPNATFIRNGSEYDAQQAADHLRFKLRNAGERVKTAEDFITHCATGSSISGEKYQIRFEDGKMIDSAVFLREKLATYLLQGQPAPLLFDNNPD